MLRSFTRSGAFLLALGVVTPVVVAGCSTGDDDDDSSTGGGAGMSGTPAGSVDDCHQCMKAADCKSGFCNAVTSELGVCTLPDVLDCKLDDTRTLRGLSGKAFSAEGSVPTPPTPGSPVAVTADDPNIVYSGRIDFTKLESPRFSSPGVSVRARFDGTSVVVKFKDEFRYGKRNYYDAVIDEGKVAADGSSLAFSIKLTPGTATYYPVISGLPKGEHSITFVKRSEANIGYGDFFGFEFDGPILDPGPKRARKIEIIGDSISCGVGDDLPLHKGQNPDDTYCKEDDWGVPYHDAYLTFGAVAARALDAEYHVTAVSGIGVTRVYSSNASYDLRTMPEVYDKLYLEDTASPAWDTSRYVPDVVVIALGTNDFSPGDNPTDMPREQMTVEKFVPPYEDFIDTLMGYYPDAEFVLLSSPMLSDDWPDPSFKYKTSLEESIAQIEADYAKQGGKVHAFNVYDAAGQGCGTHPSALEHQKIADMNLIPALREVMGW